MVAKTIPLPNIRKLFQPDPGYTFFNVDLKSADLYVVIWEADDDDLRAKMAAGVNMHIENAKDIFGHCNGGKSDNPNSPYHRAKQGVHATNYYCQDKTLALAINCTVHEASTFRKRWFGAHPGILEWHERTQASLNSTRSVRNAFGFVRHFFERPEQMLSKALAWVPQSTVANVIDEIIVNLDELTDDIQLALQHDTTHLEPYFYHCPQLQVHDSAAGQYATFLDPAIRPLMHRACSITVPYEKPLHIPIGLTLSTKSWGDCAGEGNADTASWGNLNAEATRLLSDAILKSRRGSPVAQLPQFGGPPARNINLVGSALSQSNSGVPPNSGAALPSR